MDERYSGVAEYTRLLVQHLLEQDSRNQYFLYYNSRHDVSGRLPRFDFPNARFVRTRIPNKIFHYPFLKFLGRPYFDRLVQKQTGERMDIFFMPHLNFAAWSPAVKSVVAVHDLSFYHFPEFFNWRKNLWHRLLGVRGLLRRFDQVVAFSKNSAEDIGSLTGIAPERISVIPSGVEAKFRKLAADDPELLATRAKYSLPDRFILALSTVEPRKNIEGLIEAFEVLKGEQGSDDLKLIIAGGRGWKSAPIYRRAARSAYSSDIIFLGYVPAEDRPALYNAATVFAFPSFYEGFGFPPLEAMACGTPTVVATASCLPEVVGQGALLVDSYNPLALAEAIRNIFTDKRLAAELSAAGKVQAAIFNWNKTAKAYLDIFSNVTERDAARAVRSDK